MSVDGDEAVATEVKPKDEGDEEVRPPTPPQSHVILVDHDPPMFRLEISLHSWELGDCETLVVVPRRGELADLLRWAPLEQRRVICGNLRARVQQELAEVFAVLEGWRADGSDVRPAPTADRPE